MARCDSGRAGPAGSGDAGRPAPPGAGGAPAAPGSGWAVAGASTLGACVGCNVLGTGSGAIALAIKKERPDAEVHAVDASASALSVAAANAARLLLDVAFRPGSWLAGDNLQYDLIASNPPCSPA